MGYSPWGHKESDTTEMTWQQGQMRASQVVLVVKNPLASVGDIRAMDLIPGSGRSPGGGHGNPLQYSCLKNPWTEELERLLSIGSQRVRHN